MGFDCLQVDSVRTELNGRTQGWCRRTAPWVGQVHTSGVRSEVALEQSIEIKGNTHQKVVSSFIHETWREVA